MKKTNSAIDLESMTTEIIKTSFSDCFEIIPGDLTSEFSRNTASSIEFATYKTLFETVKPEVCLDIGTNIGAHALFFAKYCRQVYAFEPNPYIYAILQRNIKRNEAIVQAFPFGLSDSAADLDLHIDVHWNTGHSSFVADNASENAQLVSTRVEKGDEILAKEHIERVDFIKIDTEGYEANVLLGLKHCILRDKPVIALEWNTDITRENFTKYEILKTFFPDYISFGLGSSWHKNLYPTIASKIKRGIVKNVLKRKRSLVLQEFVFHRDYELVFLLPERFRDVVGQFLFLPPGYVPTVKGVCG